MKKEIFIIHTSGKNISMKIASVVKETNCFYFCMNSKKETIKIRKDDKSVYTDFYTASEILMERANHLMNYHLTAANKIMDSINVLTRINKSYLIEGKFINFLRGNNEKTK